MKNSLIYKRKLTTANTAAAMVNRKGKSTRDRALAIIGLAHPSLQEELMRAAEDMYLL